MKTINYNTLLKFFSITTILIANIGNRGSYNASLIIVSFAIITVSINYLKEKKDDKYDFKKNIFTNYHESLLSTGFMFALLGAYNLKYSTKIGLILLCFATIEIIITQFIYERQNADENSKNNIFFKFKNTITYLTLAVFALSAYYYFEGVSILIIAMIASYIILSVYIYISERNRIGFFNTKNKKAKYCLISIVLDLFAIIFLPTSIIEYFRTSDQIYSNRLFMFCILILLMIAYHIFTHTTINEINDNKS